MSEPQLMIPPFTSLLQPIHSDANPEGSKRQLADALFLLFEHSPILEEHVDPQLIHRLHSTSGSGPTNYAAFIDLTIDLVTSLPDDKKAAFIGAHPHIGEVKGLSALSASERGQMGQAAVSAPAPAPTPTPPEVLTRQAFLNKLYERRYPRPVYITFVNGLSHTQIRDELEDKLRGEAVLPADDSSSGIDGVVPLEVGGNAWKMELDRAIGAVRDIAQSRLGKLGVE